MPGKAGKHTSKKSVDDQTIFNDQGYVLTSSTLNVILGMSPSGVVVVGSDFIIEYINEKGCEIFGGSREDLVGHDFRDFLQKDTVQMMAERYQLRRKGKKVPSTYLFHIIRRDGEDLVVEGSADVAKGPDGNLRTVAHFLDITQIQRRQEELEQSQTRYQTLVETMNEGLVIDNSEGILIYANDAFYNMIHSSPAAIIGKPWNSLVPDMSMERVKEKIEERKKGVSERYEMTWKTTAGALVPTIISAKPLFGRNGDFLGTFAIVTEIKAQKDAEETIQFYLDLLSHDVANQLQVIMTSSGLLEEDVPQSYVDDAAKNILDAVERCNRLITKVKRAAQIREVPISSVELTQALSEKIGVLKKVYAAKVHFEEPKRAVMVEADILLGELLWNLLENAAYHNPAEHREVWVSIGTNRESVELSIADNGPGISDIRKRDLFAERKYGSGVGLRLVRQMISKYGGSIEVEDRVKGNSSKGSKFIVTLRRSRKSK